MRELRWLRQQGDNLIKSKRRGIVYSLILSSLIAILSTIRFIVPTHYSPFLVIPIIVLLIINFVMEYSIKISAEKTDKTFNELHQELEDKKTENEKLRKELCTRCNEEKGFSRVGVISCDNQRKVALLKGMVAGVGRIRNKSLNFILKNLRSKYKSDEIIPLVTKPESTIDAIVETIEGRVLEHFGIPRSETANSHTSLAYRINSIKEHKEWAFLGETHKPENSDPREITKKNVPSTFNAVLKKTRERFVFWNSKKDALEANEYVSISDPSHMPGSIFCLYTSVGDGNTTYIEAVLSMQTQTEPFVKAEDSYKETLLKTFLTDFILRHYEQKLKFELLLLYIEKRNEDIEMQNKICIDNKKHAPITSA
ncbi:MAG: hypothetical protein FWE02_07340 [Defluviitaleaceae bacterium]|nr:hypothetical protein [Defluviitaleaceae bacterium]